MKEVKKHTTTLTVELRLFVDEANDHQHFWFCDVLNDARRTIGYGCYQDQASAVQQALARIPAWELTLDRPPTTKE